MQRAALTQTQTRYLAMFSSRSREGHEAAANISFFPELDDNDLSRDNSPSDVPEQPMFGDEPLDESERHVIPDRDPSTLNKPGSFERLKGFGSPQL